MMSDNSTAQIKCIGDSHFYFNQSQYIRITNLVFIGCGGNQVNHVEKLVVEDTKFEGEQNTISGTALELTDTRAQIVNGVFLTNRKGSYRHCPVYFSHKQHSCLAAGFIGGAIIVTNSTIDIGHGKFEDNRAANYGGAIFAKQNSIIRISSSVFISNVANFGGALFLYNSTIIVNASKFQSNAASASGGVVSSFSSTIMIEASEFHGNTAYTGGVLVLSTHSVITIEASEFDSNIASFSGVLYSDRSKVTIEASAFHSNVAKWRGLFNFVNGTSRIKGSEFHSNSAFNRGGVMNSHCSTITIEASKFRSNTVARGGIGGVLYSFTSTITVGNSTFINNNSPKGAVIFAMRGTKICYYSSLLIHNNTADDYAVIYLADSELRGHNTGNFIFSSNTGSIVVFNSNISFSGYVACLNNQPPSSMTGDLQKGGAITLFQSNVFFDGTCKFEYNRAESGGAILSIDSKIYVNGNVTIAHNTATRNGGGVYLSISGLYCQKGSTLVLYNNTAMSKGGGVHSISSMIKASSNIEHHGFSDYDNTGYIGTRLKFASNAAKFGGGLSLEANAKLYVLRYNSDSDINTTILFRANSADYGGAVYVDDNSNSGTCVSEPKTDCFFQVLVLYEIFAHNLKTLQSILFSQNYASISGSTLYGGLLDRCAVSQFAEMHEKYTPHDIHRGGGIAYFRNISATTTISISSGPVRVCLYVNGVDDCLHHHQYYVRKGEAFMVLLAAIDQVGHPVSATIQASLSSAEGGLDEGQLARNISAKFTNITFNVISPHDSETLALYSSDGPCGNVELSKATIKVNFLPCSCPIGLQISEVNSTNCTCKCHSDIGQYMKQCDSHTGSLFKLPKTRAWISHINDTDLTGYLVYPNCPFDYCLPTSPLIYLNKPGGADAQCAYNRSSLLCGSCQPGLSLSLGSSRCLPCPSYWPALLIAITIAAILAGIALVAILLILNMTVAVGTLNGVIFYANVVYANKSILISFEETNYVTVLISWLNLELGIDTCYFPGMDTYIKAWLQLAFPVYVILLVVLVIIISSYSTKFSYLIGKKNPVATLATLILLSYAKLLEVCFNSLSVGTLEYPDSSREMLWLPDATVKYLSAKHIPLFISAVVILLAGLIYTALLFSWQCLLHLPKWKIFKWSRNPRIQTFVETYHAPHTPKHRYWTGLLLIARVILHFVASTNVSNDPTVTLISISIVIVFLIFLKGFTMTKVYKNWSVDVLETFLFLNIFIFTISKWYSLGNEHNFKCALAYTSVTIAILALLLVIFYHVYTYTIIFSKVKRTKFGRIMGLFIDTNPEPKHGQHRYSPPPDNDIHRFDELLDELDCPVNTDDYNATPLLQPVEPTFSVVELPKVHNCLPPDPI